MFSSTNICGLVLLLALGAISATGVVMALEPKSIQLPRPNISDHELVQLLQQRRSVREFRDEALSLRQLGQLLWAAQGVTSPQGYRTAPSAGALYPLELYIAVGKVKGLEAGIYHYYPDNHSLVNSITGDFRKTLAHAALQQPWVRQAPLVLIIAGKYARTTHKYGNRGIRYVHIEAGSAAQNVYLQAQALGLGTVIVGAFDDKAVADALRLASDMQPLLLMPIGTPQ
jgi:SagB-type dehydrogenase family enzyme